MNRNRRRWFSVLVAAAAAYIPTTALGYTADNTCLFWGSVTWGQQTVNVYRDTCSAPTGSAVANAQAASFSYYTGPAGLGARFYNGFTYNDNCTITFGNGRNEFATVPRSSISGLNGLTLKKWSTCVFSPATYTEADVMIAGDMTFDNEDPSFYNWNNLQQGQVTIVHEYGHFFGLGHQAGFDVMQTGSPWPIVGGSWWHGEPFPDDMNGVGQLNGVPISTNVFASAQYQLNGTTTATGPSATVQRCRGNFLNVRFTFGNNGGTAANNLGYRIFLSSSPPSFAAGTNIGTGTISLPAFSTNTQYNTYWVPNLPNGLYWIGWQIDTNGTLLQTSYSDDVSYSAETISINC